MKRVISFVLALALVCTLLPTVVPKAEATTSTPEYKKAVLSVNWTNIKAVGKQDFSGAACSCYALAYCTTLLDNSVHHFSEYNQYGNDEYNVSCVWGNGGFVGYSYPNRTDAFKRLYRDIVKGTPIIAKVVKPGISTHYVAVVGFENITSFDNLSTSNFLIIDPGTSKFEIQNMGSLGYSLSSSNFICYNYTSKTIGFSIKTANNTSCGLSFNSNGGSAINSITTTSGTAVTIPSTVPAKFGYDFTGWATSATGSATYQPGDTITVSQDTTLYAVWYKASHTVRASASLGGTATIKYPGVGNYISFIVETDGTYEIKGLIGSNGYVDSMAWLYDSDGVGIALDDDSGGNGLFRIEAELEAGEEYTLYMKAYDSSFTGWFNWRISALEEQVVGTTINDKYLGLATVSEPGSMDYYLFTPTVSDTYVIYSVGDTDSMVYLYDSKGVQLASDDQGGEGNNFRLAYYMTAGTTYQFGIKLFDSSATDVVSFAFGKVYNLMYDANGGSNAPASQECDFGRALRLSNSIPTREGYSFLGWSGSADASYAMWQPGQSINIGEDTTLYAVWEPQISGSGQAVISTPGSTVWYTFTAPVDRTYVIYSTGDLDSKVNLYDNNWVLLASNDDGGDNHNFRLQYDMTEGETYHFEIALYSSSATGTVDYTFGRTYKVSYDANGGSMAPSTQYRDTGSTLVLSESMPVRGEYTFLGWATAPDATSAEYQPGDGFVGIWDTTLYAVWEKETQICEHTNRQVSVSVWPSTLTTGTLTLTCTSCTDVETVTLPKFNTTDYTYSVVRAATCTTQGVGRYTWKNTEYGEQFFNVAIPAGHTYEATVTAPTCTEQGYTTHTCDCGDSYVDSYVSALGHRFTNYKANNNATCTVDGTKTAKCDRCSETNTLLDDGSKLNHSFTNYISNNDATYEADGTKTAKCDRCEETDTVTDPGTKIPRPDGWVQEDGAWYCYEAGVKHTGWLNTNGVWYYMDAAGVMQTGWKQVNGYWYYFESNGVMAANAWRKDSKGWCYLGANGAMRTNAWVQDTKGWCYVGADGYCWTNKWAKDSKGWIWLDSEGSMTKSKWIQYNGAWYYLNSDGYMTTGWQKINNNWYYLGTNGVMTTGWQKVNNTWYYMASNGVMTTGWQKVNNNWYYLGTNGAMVTGWVQIGSTWYYLHDSGVMATGTVKIGAKTYKFASNGVWIS